MLHKDQLKKLVKTFPDIKECCELKKTYSSVETTSNWRRNIELSRWSLTFKSEGDAYNFERDVKMLVPEKGVMWTCHRAYVKGEITLTVNVRIFEPEVPQKNFNWYSQKRRW